ncbi:MAG: ATP-binding cassette domain-containing protein, partial [Thermofilaceae archaeon]|nr:ATP-binding cassette domain-containing protein [Thermofilaceae archaeon]
MRVTLGGKEILKGVTTIFQGKHILLGPNGHGKTTLFKTIAGLYPFRGTVLIEGIPLSKMKGGLG